MRFPLPACARFNGRGLPALLILIAAGCLLWSVFGRKPWETSALDPEKALRDIPLEDYIAAGLWLGLTASGAIAALLAATWRFWGSNTETIPAPVRRPAQKPAKWFLVLLAMLTVFSGIHSWPAMTNSFWGDEGWAFADYVHGKWRPVEKGGSLQGPMKFREVPWDQAIFGDQNANNHWLSTILQRLTLKLWQKAGNRENWEFEEWVPSFPSYLAGLGSLIVLACFLNSLGRPIDGILAALFMAFHPWHLRFSAEAKGYALMGFFLIVTLWTLTVALRRGGLWHWMAFGLSEFLVMYSWKGALYPLVFMNLVAAWVLVWTPSPDRLRRQTAIARWMAANLFGAMFFAPLAAPSQLQIRKTIDDVRQRARPMDYRWAINTLSDAIDGMPYYEEDPLNPREVSFERLSRESPFPVMMLWVIAILMAAGAWRLWRRDKLLAGLIYGILLSAVAAACHFKFGVKVELLSWYLYFSLPALAILLGASVSPVTALSAVPLDGRGWLARAVLRLGVAPAVLPFFFAFESRMETDLRNYPREDFRGAWQMTRGRHEPTGYDGPSTVYTAWLWRHLYSYDPRADTHVRDAASLRRKMDLARNEGAEFYMIVGHRDLSELLNRDVLDMLEDPAEFDAVGILWGAEKLNTLYVYRLRPEASRK